MQFVIILRLRDLKYNFESIDFLFTKTCLILLALSSSLCAGIDFFPDPSGDSNSDAECSRADLGLVIDADLSVASVEQVRVRLHHNKPGKLYCLLYNPGEKNERCTYTHQQTCDCQCDTTHCGNNRPIAECYFFLSSLFGFVPSAEGCPPLSLCLRCNS